MGNKHALVMSRSELDTTSWHWPPTQFVYGTCTRNLKTTKYHSVQLVYPVHPISFVWREARYDEH
jgi:hypothetical protein